MRNVFYNLLGILLLMCTSCTSSSNFFSDNIKQFDASLKMQKLSPDTIFQAEMGTIAFTVLDGKFVYTTGGRDTIFYVYNGDQFLGAYGQRGRGADEFLNSIDCGQKFKEGDTIGMWINDMMSQEMKLVDVLESARQNRTVIIGKKRTCDLGLNSYVLNDSAVLIQQYAQYKNVNLIYYNSVNKQRRVNELYTPVNIDPFVLYLNAMQIRPKGDKIATAMCHLDQINILSLKDSSRVAVTAGKPILNTVNAIKKNWQGRPDMLYYNYLVATNDYIFALYMNQPREKFARELQPVAVHVLDWDGNLVMCIKVDEYLTRISVDDENQQLYGFSIIGEKVYRYNLKNIL